MPIFSKSIRVSESDVEGGRVTHIALVALLQQARLAFLAKHGMKEDSIIPGVGFVIGELNVRYTGAARQNDMLNISLNISNISEKKCTIAYEIKTEPQNKIIGFAKTEIVFVDMMKEKATKIPDEFLEIIQARNDNKPSVTTTMSRL